MSEDQVSQIKDGAGSSAGLLDLPPTNAARLEAQADRCRRLASCIDGVISARLLKLADEFAASLAELTLG
jgi:hypothetical protein